MIDIDTLLEFKPDVRSPEAHLSAAAAGVFLHVFAYRRGEWDLWVPTLITGYAAIYAGLTAWVFKDAEGLDWKEKLLATAPDTAVFVAYHLLGVFSSILVYRLFFHRLGKYPGPFWGKVWNLYPTFLRRQWRLFEEVEALHEKYGDVVRLGPNELSIIDPKATQAIYATRSPCTKGPFYNVLHPRWPLNMIRDKDQHTERRKIWDRGFSAKALRQYEPRVHMYTDQLLTKLESLTGKPINIAEWFNFYSFDVMGDLAFGKSFNMLQNGKKHYFMTNLHDSMAINGLLAHITWIFPMLKVTPILNRDYNNFWVWCEKQVEQRKQLNPPEPDVFSWLLEGYENGPKTKQDKLNLDGEAYLIAVAGSDTTAASLTVIFYELVNNPEQYQKLRDEIDEYFKTNNVIESVSISKLQHLNAVINEALRLHPPVASGVQRVTPPEGLKIGDRFIPGNAVVVVPTHTVQRDERNYARANEFIPERWTTSKDLVYDDSSYAPFSIGAYSCVGKQLGLMEIRYVVTRIVRDYDIKFAPTHSNQKFLRSKKDAFTLAIPGLDVTITPRKQ